MVMALPSATPGTGGDESARIYDRGAIKRLGDALVDDTDGTSPVSHLEEAGTFPPNMRLGWGALGVIGLPLTQEHDKIVAAAERKLGDMAQSLHGHRDELYTASGNVDAAEVENMENVRRI
ncbi:hypothetical protein [Nonomuraea sp. NPDC049158]|uniref:hypothetical protein n=1 Tax=Nonomuraea sp. NPDC049158 TaxID=3155649 RepID=UPI0033EF6407